MISLAPATAQRNAASFVYQAAVSEALDRIFRLDSAEATELLLVRHAEPDVRGALKAGKTDPPLTERGRCQAMRLAMRLRRERIDAVYTSTARAALETAAVVAAARDMPMIRAPQLAGVSCARQGPNKSDRRRMAAEATVRLLNNPRWDSLPGFEPSRQFRHRAIQTIEAIVSRHTGERVVLVTHEAVVNVYLSMVLGICRDMFFLPAHASMSVVRVHRDLYGVQNLNDCSHLLQTFTPR